MKGFIEKIEGLTEKNSNFRRVLYTGKELQLVLMSLKPGEEIGEEIHKDHDQFFRVESGEGLVWIDGKQTRIEKEIAIVIPAGAKHNIKNVGEKPLRMYTIYGPPVHEDGTIQVTKSDAMASKEHFAGHTTE